MSFDQVTSIYSIKTRTKLQFMKTVMGMIRSTRKAVGLPNQFVSKRRGMTFDLDLDEAIDGCLYLVHDYEPELTKAFGRIIYPGCTVLDIGANIGAHTLTLARLVGDTGRVFAFEPSRFGLEKLRRNLDLNPTLGQRVQVEAVFLNDGKSQIPAVISSSWNIARNIDDPERNVLDGGFQSEVLSKTGMSLDQWLAKNQTQQNITRIDAIKLDVDGGEVEILRGAIETFRAFKPVLFMELSPIHFKNHSYRFQDQIEAIQSLGYRLYTLEGKPLPNNAKKIETMIPYGSLVNVLGVSATGVTE